MLTFITHHIEDRIYQPSGLKISDNSVCQGTIFSYRSCVDDSCCTFHDDSIYLYICQKL